jgi:RNA polymerase sigma-70 factor (ECF subfamily)
MNEPILSPMDPEIAQHIPRLRRYARALAGDRYRADDLVQDTLERACRKFHLWRRGSDLRAWLFSVMHNVFVNQVRARRLDEEEFVDATALPTQPERIDLLDLERALARLSIEQREVVLLVGIEQMTYEEVAKALGIPIGTVMSRLARAREKLRTLMSGAPPVVNLKAVK